MGWEIEANCMSSEETCTVNQWHDTCSPNNTPEQLFVADLVVLTRKAYQRTIQERRSVLLTGYSSCLIIWHEKMKSRFELRLQAA